MEITIIVVSAVSIIISAITCYSTVIQNRRIAEITKATN